MASASLVLVYAVSSCAGGFLGSWGGSRIEELDYRSAIATLEHGVGPRKIRAAATKLRRLHLAAERRKAESIHAMRAAAERCPEARQQLNAFLEKMTR